MSTMRVLVRLPLAVVFTAAIVLVAFLLLGPKSKETWSTLTAVLAVIAAVISAWPSLRVLEIQEDATRPCPTPHFDLTSRYGLFQLRVKNIGAGVAYDVRLNWDQHPQNAAGDEVAVLDTISVLMPQDSVSIVLGTSLEMVEKYPSLRFEGTVAFKDVAGKERSQRFRCSADEYRSRLTFDQELPKTLHELQKLPEELEKIHKAIAILDPNVKGSK
jgi:hypothetical protein